MGTAGPSAQLQVHSQQSNFEILRLVGDTAEHGSLKIYSGSYNSATIGYHQQGYFMASAQSSNQNGAFFIRADKGIDFGQNNTGSLSIQSGSGNVVIDDKVKVGIGTASPDSLLEISSDSVTDFLKLTSTSGTANPIKLIFEKGVDIYKYINIFI